jgi:hypothetical protein
MDKLLSLYHANITVEQLLTALKEIGNIAAYSVLSEAYPDIEFYHSTDVNRRQQFVVNCRQENLVNGVQKISSVNQRISSPEKSKQIIRGHILITSSRDVRKYSMHLFHWLRANSFHADILLGDADFNDFVKFEQAQFVIIVISPEYLKEIADHSRPSLASTIYRLVQIELSKTSFDNRRFIPVFLDEVPVADTKKVPLLLSNTLSYRYPSEGRKLFDFITDSFRRR